MSTSHDDLAPGQGKVTSDSIVAVSGTRHGNAFHAVSSVCARTWAATWEMERRRRRRDCPCHGFRASLSDGKQVLRGPASRPLPPADGAPKKRNRARRRSYRALQPARTGGPADLPGGDVARFLAGGLPAEVTTDLSSTRSASPSDRRRRSRSACPKQRKTRRRRNSLRLRARPAAATFTARAGLASVHRARRPLRLDADPALAAPTITFCLKRPGRPGQVHDEGGRGSPARCRCPPRRSCPAIRRPA